MRHSILSITGGAGRLRVLSVALVFLGATGCRRAEPGRDALYVSAPFAGLAEGLFDGEVTFAELKQHGDVALGAIESSNGELVVVDGRCYQVKGDGSVAVLQDWQKTPFAIAKLFHPDRTLEVTEEVDYPRLRKLLDEKLGNPSLPYAFRIEGSFSHVKTRSVAGQKQPYRRLIEVIKDQVVFELQNVSGVMVGFRIPAYVEGINVPGYHLHFVTADRTAGGHVLAFRSAKLHVAADAASAIEVALPHNSKFAASDFSHMDKNEWDQILGRVPLDK
jgi:acetolactate decarboxylase